MRAVVTLQQRLRGAARSMDARIWRGVWGAVAALIRGGDLRPAVLGRYSRRETSQKHRVKAADRLVGNPRLHRARNYVYAVIARLLVRSSKSVVVTVDWTQIDAKHHAIVGAIPIGGRALPIVSRVFAKAAIPTRAMHRAFLRDLASVLPPRCIPILVTDAGFQGSWVQDVMSRGWQFVTRLRHRTCVRLVGTTTWTANKSLHRKARTRARDLGEWDVGKEAVSARYSSRLVLAKRVAKRRHRKGRRGKRLRGGSTQTYVKRYSEPWLLASNLSVRAELVVDLYAERMQIEELFRDAKSSTMGWSLSAVRSKDPKRLENLLLIATLGMFVVLATGIAAERQGVHRSLQANTEVRRVLSYFKLGCLVLTTETQRQLTPRDIREAIRSLSTGPST